MDFPQLEDNENVKVETVKPENHPFEDWNEEELPDTWKATARVNGQERQFIVTVDAGWNERFEIAFYHADGTAKEIIGATRDEWRLRDKLQALGFQFNGVKTDGTAGKSYQPLRTYQSSFEVKLGNKVLVNGGEE